MKAGVGALDDLITPTRLHADTLLDDSSVLHVAGSSGIAGDYQGAHAIETLFARMGDLTDHTLRIDRATTLIDTDDAIVIHGHERARRPKGRLDTDLVLVLSIDTGVLREAWLFHADQPAVDSFWMVA